MSSGNFIFYVLYSIKIVLVFRKYTFEQKTVSEVASKIMMSSKNRYLPTYLKLSPNGIYHTGHVWVKQSRSSYKVLR